MTRPQPDFASAVLDLVAEIPPGNVMSYGDIAAALGSRGARTVGTVLARSGADVPWWRVIRSSGHAAAGQRLQPLCDREAAAFAAELCRLGEPFVCLLEGGVRAAVAAGAELQRSDGDAV